MHPFDAGGLSGGAGLDAGARPPNQGWKVGQALLFCKKCDVLWSKVPRDKDYLDIDATVKMYKKRRCPDCGRQLEEVTFVSGLSG